jgi:GntR family transcriptional regulator
MRALDPASGLPLYLQVARALQEDIAAGALVEGDAAPSLRETAAELRINVHTVAKAYQLLEREGVLVRRRGDPFRVAAAATAAEDLLREDIEALFARAASVGFSERELLELMERMVVARERRRA